MLRLMKKASVSAPAPNQNASRDWNPSPSSAARAVPPPSTARLRTVRARGAVICSSRQRGRDRQLLTAQPISGAEDLEAGHFGGQAGLEHRSDQPGELPLVEVREREDHVLGAVQAGERGDARRG